MPIVLLGALLRSCLDIILVVEPELKSIEDLNKLIEEKQSKLKPRIWPYVAAALALPPFSLVIALYFAWRKNLLHRALPLITIANSAITALYFFSIFSFYSALSSLGEIKRSSPSINLVSILLGIVLVAGVAGGFYLKRKAEKENHLALREIFFLLALVGLQFVLIFFLAFQGN